MIYYLTIKTGALSCHLNRRLSLKFNNLTLAIRLVFHTVLDVLVEFTLFNRFEFSPSANRL